MIMKKILFNDKFLLTQAVLEGRKTQTRRIIPKDFFSLTWDKRDDTLVYENGMGDFIDVRNSKYALYKVGEVVAVAQSYESISNSISKAESKEKAIFYCKVMKTCFPDAIIHKDKEEISGWYNKMFVKPKLMLHQICITNVRVEKLEDISEQDAIAEGITYAGLTYDDYGEPMFVIDGCKKTFSSAKDAYAWLIDKISGKGTWLSNPYVFVYDFELVK